MRITNCLHGCTNVVGCLKGNGVSKSCLPTKSDLPSDGATKSNPLCDEVATDSQALNMPWFFLRFYPWCLAWQHFGGRGRTGVSLRLQKKRHHICLGREIPLVRSVTCCFSSSLHKSSYRAYVGQTTLEAAVLIPSVLALIALLIQPACLLYTQMLMRGAAAETARAVLTARSETDLVACKDFCLRRLQAVPEVSVFHVGGQNDWQIQTEQAGAGSVHVSIVGHARPLPLFGTLAAVFHERDGAGLLLKIDTTEKLRPAWLGGDYADWISVWK